METVTLLVALFASLLILVLRPIYGLCVFCAALFCYPQRLTVPIFTLDFTVARIAVVVLIVRAVCSSDIRHRFKLTVIDAWIWVLWAAMFFAYQLNAPLKLVITREGGAVMDTILPYLAVRLIVNSRAGLITFSKGIAFISIPLAVFGVIQSVTGYNVAGFMDRYAAWGLDYIYNYTDDVRMGLHRATVTFGNYIAYGLYFPCAAALVLALWHQKVWPKPVVAAILFLFFLGLAASVSSGPLFGFVVMTAFALCFPLRRYWPIGAAVLIAVIIFVEMFSNRHFYHVLTRFAFSGETAYYRIKLIDEAFGGGMDDHWLAGYGYVGAGPGNDNSQFHWQQKDLVNLYIHDLARTGLIGTIPLFILNVMFYVRLYKAARRSRDPSDQWTVWALAAGLVGLNLALMSVSPLEQIMTMFYMLIAVANSLPIILATGRAGARSGGWLVVYRVPRSVIRVAEART